MLPYFPFSANSYTMTLGVQALHAGLVEIEATSYTDEIKLKNELLRAAHEDYFQALPGTEQLQWEAIETLLPAMASDYPHYFTLTIEGSIWHWHNVLLGEETRFVFGDTASLPLAPLDWLGRQVQEDLLMLEHSETMPLAAGQLCFPNAWCLTDKLGQPFLTIHQDVPHFAQQLGRSSMLLLARLKAGRPVWRVNWAIKSLPRLNLTPSFAAEVEQSHRLLTRENIGERCFLRIERQGLCYLPRTQGILFTIHTYQDTIAHVAHNAGHAQAILTTLRTTPAETLAYKGIAPFSDLLLNYLETLPANIQQKR